MREADLLSKRKYYLDTVEVDTHGQHNMKRSCAKEAVWLDGARQCEDG